MTPEQAKAIDDVQVDIFKLLRSAHGHLDALHEELEDGIFMLKGRLDVILAKLTADEAKDDADDAGEVFIAR